MFAQTSDGIEYVSSLSVVVTTKAKMSMAPQQPELPRPISSGELADFSQNSLEPVSEILVQPAPAPSVNLTRQFIVPIDLSPLPSQKLLPFGLGTGAFTSLFSNTAFTNTLDATNACTIIGKFSNSNNCSTYNHCYGFGRGQLGLICPRDFAFDAHYKHCSMNWSSCPLLARCTSNGQLIADPTDITLFYICVLNRNSIFATTYEKQYSVFRRSCATGMRFNVATQNCVPING